MTVIDVLLPNDIDDPRSPSGGNTYDRRICDGLAESGWAVREHAVAGGWPTPTAAERAALGELLAGLDVDALVLIDGLIASAVPEVLLPHSGRLRLVVLVHMPFADAAEGEALGAATAVITTSRWSRRRVIDLYGLPAARVHAAPPGVDGATLTERSASGGRLLCVAAVARHKGHDVLLDALSGLADTVWGLVCVGSLDRDPEYAALLRARAADAAIGDRVRWSGARAGAELHAAYAEADLLVLPSRGETYGMVVTEALARGVPVLTTNVGGLPESLGSAGSGRRPGLLVAPEDPAALEVALRRWLTEPDLRDELRRSALVRRSTLTGWSVTTTLVAKALSTVAAKVSA